MRLQRDARHAAARERGDRVLHARFPGRNHVGARFGVHITALHPYGPSVAVELVDERHRGLRLVGRHDERARKRQPGRRHPRHQAMAVAIEDALGRVDRQRLPGNEREQTLRRGGSLAHVHIQVGRRQPARGDVAFRAA